MFHWKRCGCQRLYWLRQRSAEKLRKHEGDQISFRVDFSSIFTWKFAFGRTNIRHSIRFSAERYSRRTRAFWLARLTRITVGAPNSEVRISTGLHLASDLDRVLPSRLFFKIPFSNFKNVFFLFFPPFLSAPVRLLIAETIQGSISSLVSWLELKMW